MNKINYILIIALLFIIGCGSGKNLSLQIHLDIIKDKDAKMCNIIYEVKNTTQDTIILNTLAYVDVDDKFKIFVPIIKTKLKGQADKCHFMATFTPYFTHDDSLKYIYKVAPGKIINDTLRFWACTDFEKDNYDILVVSSTRADLKTYDGFSGGFIGDINIKNVKIQLTYRPEKYFKKKGYWYKKLKSNYINF